MKFNGIMPAFVTPLNKDNKTINEKAVKKLLAYHLSLGADGFYICGGTGEGLVLDLDEREKICELIISEVKGKKPVINHVAAMNFSDTARLAKHAQKSGADAIAAVPPFYFRYDNDEIYNYYKKLASLVSIPVMIYYHPAAQNDMSAKLIAKIFEIENVTAVKWSSSNYYEMLKLKDITHGEMNIINGPDETLVVGLTAGADGGIGSTYNVMLKEYKQIYEYFINGEIEEARKTQIKVNRVVDVLIKYNVISTVKYATTLMGFDVGGATFPMKNFSSFEENNLKAELNNARWPFEEVFTK